MIDGLYERLQQHGIDAPIIPNNPKPTRSGSQWLCVNQREYEGRLITTAHFGDFKKDLNEYWCSEEISTLGPGARAEYDAQVSLLKEQAKLEKLEIQKEVALEAEKEFETFLTQGDTPYTRRKGIAGILFGARLKPNDQGDKIVAVPLRDVNGKLWNYQRIYSQKLSAGDKFFLSGARIDGLFHTLVAERETLDTKIIYIAEGYATAMSIKLSLSKGSFVAVAFNAGNLKPVAKNLLEKYPSSKFIICADNDAYSPKNIGLEKGRLAAGVTKGEVRYPVFKTPAPGLTDFNDLYCTEGADAVREQILAQKPIVALGDGELPPLPLTYSKSGEPIAPPEKAVADYLLAKLGANLIKDEKSIWRYTGTHWEELNEGGLDSLKRALSSSVEHCLGSVQLQSYWRTLVLHMRHVPRGRTLFQPNPFLANFKNGTLHLDETDYGRFELRFAKHNKEDFVTTAVDFDYPGDDAIDNPPPTPKYDAWFETIFGNEPSVKEAYEELAGNCLMQCFPIVAFFVGPSGSGKTTAVKLLLKLVSEKNLSSVPPSQWHGFLMENMIGKLVNYDTDLDIETPLRAAPLKKVFDRTPVQVQRKGRMNVVARVPSTHLFACNEMPTTPDTTRGVWKHRFLIFNADKYQAPVSASRDFERSIWDEESFGITCRFIQGLKRMAHRGGVFTQTKDSGEQIANYEVKNDIVKLFIEAIKNGDDFDGQSTLEIGAGFKVKSTQIWQMFELFQEMEKRPSWTLLGRNTFFKRMRSEGFSLEKADGTKVVRGIRCVALGGTVA